MKKNIEGDLTKDDVVIYILMRALIKAVRLAAATENISDDEVTEKVNALLAYGASSLPNASFILEKLDIDARCALSMDRLHIPTAPGKLRLILGGGEKKE